MIDHRCKGSERSRHHLRFISGSVVFIKRLSLSAPDFDVYVSRCKGRKGGEGEGWGVNAIVIEGWDIHFWLKGANNRPHFLILSRKMGMKSYSRNWVQASNANTIIPVSCFEECGYLVAWKLCKTSISVPADSSVLLMVTFHCKDFWCVLSSTVNWKEVRLKQNFMCLPHLLACVCYLPILLKGAYGFPPSSWKWRQNLVMSQAHLGDSRSVIWTWTDPPTSSIFVSLLRTCCIQAMLWISTVDWIHRTEPK